VLKEWLEFSDRKQPPGFVFDGLHVTTDRFVFNQIADFSDLGKVREEWCFRSVLVQITHLKHAAKKISYRDTEIRPGWSSSGGFDFGEKSFLDDIPIYPWIHCWEHPLTGELTVRLRSDFIDYHCLVQQHDGTFMHPANEIEAASLDVEHIAFFNSTPHVVVHVDYLRDFLCARGFGLIISTVADRFANTATQEELRIKPIEQNPFDDWASVTNVVHPPGSLSPNYYTARTSLYWNLIVLPYDVPRVERTPWYYFGEIPESSKVPVMFNVDAAGHKAELTDKSCPTYLYFKPSVLKRYLESSHRTVNFHMQSWGVVYDSIHKVRVDVGVNSKGLVNAFAPDLAKLPSNEQSYWAAFSTIPDGEICSELYETRMNNNPPESYSNIDLIQQSIDQLNKAFSNVYGIPLHDGKQPNKKDIRRINIGPLGNEVEELTQLAQKLYEFVVEGIPIKPLREIVRQFEEPNTEWRQIRLLHEIAVHRSREEGQVRAATDILRSLNRMRIAQAHRSSGDIRDALITLSGGSEPKNLREAWKVCVFSVCDCLKKLALLVNQ